MLDIFVIVGNAIVITIRLLISKGKVDDDESNLPKKVDKASNNVDINSSKKQFDSNDVISEKGREVIVDINNNNFNNNNYNNNNSTSNNNNSNYDNNAYNNNDKNNYNNSNYKENSNYNNDVNNNISINNSVNNSDNNNF